MINGEGGEGLVAGTFPVTIGALNYTCCGGVGGGTGAGAGDINTSIVTVPEPPIPIQKMRLKLVRLLQ